MAKAKTVSITIHEPFPVLFGHVNNNSNRCGEHIGPHYAANSTWYHLDDARTRRWLITSAEHLRGLGYTCTLSFEGGDEADNALHVIRIIDEFQPSPGVRVQEKTYKVIEVFGGSDSDRKHDVARLKNVLPPWAEVRVG